MGLMDKIFGTHSQHELKRIYPIGDRIEALEPEMKALSDAELKDKTILIVDDIYTTGATIEAVAKVIRTYKPCKIDALTLASGSF